MGEQKELTEMGKKVLEFLQDENREIFREQNKESFRGTKFYITVAKVKVGDFLRIYIGNESEYGMKDLEFSGLMDIKTKKFYDVRYNLSVLGFENVIKSFEIKEELQKKVQARLKEIALATGLKNIDKFKPTAEEIKDELMFNRSLEYLEEDTKDRGKDAYIKNETMDDLPFNYNYDKDNRDLGNDEIILRYIRGDENLVEEIVNNVLTEQKQNIYVTFLRYLNVRKYLEEFILGTAKETEMFDRIKKVRKACEGKKTVTITYEKDGKIWEGKVTVGERGGAEQLGLGRICGNLEDYKIWGYNISAKDRTKFYEMFGRWADLDLAHITGIKYNGKECLA